MLYSTNEKNVLETENILDPAGSVIASKRFLDLSELGTEKYANKYYIFNYDTRNSVTNVIAPKGTVAKGYDYDEFGNTEQKGEADFLNDITFTSSVADTSSNLQYMNSRFYQPSTGRFLSQDSYSGNPYDPWTQHLYVYCGNNPTSMIDPTGHYSQELIDDVLSGKYGMFGGISNLTTEQINGGGVQIDWQRTGAVAVGVISVFVGLFMWIYDGGATFSRGLQALGF